MTLQRKLFILAGLLVTIPLVAVVVINRFVLFRYLEDQAQAESQTLATELARSTGRFMEGAISQLETLARTPAVVTFDAQAPAAVEAALTRAIATSPGFQKFYIATAEGRVTIKVRKDGKPVVKNELIDYRGYFQKAKAGQTVISDVLTSNTSEKPIIVLATPIRGSREVKGVLCGLIDPNRLFAHIYELAAGRGVVPFVIDRNWIVIAHPDRDRVFVENVMDQFTPENWSVMESFKDLDAGHGVMTYQGEKVLFAFQWHEPTGWTHIVSRPYRDFTASLAATRNTALAVLAAGLLLTVLVTRRTVRRITAPVRDLVASTRRVKEGDLDEQVDVHTTDEIGELGEAFNVMVVGLREREAMRSAQERMRYELESARVIQQSFLPTTLPGADDPRFSLAAVNHPAERVGGDYYDVITLGPDRLGIVLGDVSGKGVPGALYMARLVSDFRFLADPHEDSPADTLTQLNSLLAARGQQGMFVTLQYLSLHLETGLITLANAGHLPMLVRRSDGKVETADGVAGPPLGIVEDLVYDNAEIALAPGDDILLFTDGVTEAMNVAREFFTQERLMDVVRRAPVQPVELLAAVLEAVEAFSGEAEAHDDITLLAARWEGQDLYSL